MRSSNERQFIRWLANQKWIKKRFVSSFNANNIIFLLWCDRFDIFGCIPSENCAIKCKLSLKGESSERLDGTTCNLIWKLLTKWLDEIKRGARANPAVIGLSYFGNPANFVCVAFWFFFFYTTKNRLYATKRLAHFILFVTSNATLFFSIFVLFSHFSSSMIFFFFAFDSKDNWLAFGLFTFVLYKKQPLQTNRLAFSQRRFSVKSILYVFIEHEFRSIILSCHLVRCNQITMFIRLERRF